MHSRWDGYEAKAKRIASEVQNTIAAVHKCNEINVAVARHSKEKVSRKDFSRVVTCLALGFHSVSKERGSLPKFHLGWYHGGDCVFGVYWFECHEGNGASLGHTHGRRLCLAYR